MWGILFKKGYLAVSALMLVCIATAALFYGESERHAFSAGDAINNAIDSPSEHISAEELSIYPDKAVINKKGLIWARVLDTHSMEPALNANSISLEIMPGTSSEINVGDIISYSHDGMVIIHRVISVGEDSEGWFAVTKGDNNKEADAEKVRFGQLKGLVVGVLY